MATITIDFIGICTHFHDWYGGDVPHRVVCVDGRSINRIRPHFVTLSVYAYETGPAILELPLKRQIIRVFQRDREYQGPFVYESGYHALIPSLRGKTTPVNDVIVSGRGVAAFFDLRGGTFAHKCFDAAHACRVTIGDIEVPSLEIGFLDDRFAKGRVSLPDGALVELQHTERPMKKDTDNSHFRLHYLVSGEIPDDSKWIPEDKDACVGRSHGGVSLNVGCSNSTFP